MLAVNVFSEGIDDFGIVEVKNNGIEFTRIFLSFMKIHSN